MITKEQIEKAFDEQIFQFVTVKVVVIEDGKVLLGRRQGKKNDTGLFELPGGKLEKWETVQQAGERETLEETGVKVRLIGVDGDYYQPLVVLQYDATIIFVVFKAEVLDKQNIQSENEEMSEIGFYGKDEVKKFIDGEMIRPIFKNLFEKFMKGDFD